MADETFAGQTILIAGGGSGMGLALARRCIDAGASVTIVGRTDAKLQAACRALGSPAALDAVVADVSSEPEVVALFSRMTRLDHVVCTAADLTGAYERLADLDLAALQRAVASKVYAPFLLAKHGAARIAASGSLTVTSGIAAYRPSVRGTAVAAVNAALEGLVRALALELAPVRVNAVSPGWVDTPIWTAVAGEAKAEVLDAMARRLPVGRIGQPDDIAEAIAFLMSNRFTTGTVLHVEGGHRLV